MGKNKRKSVSKVIISRPISNGSDNDEDLKSEELHKLPSPSNLPEEDLTTIVKIELEPEIIQLVEQKQEQMVEQKQEEPVEQKQDTTLEQKEDETVEQKEEQMVEQKEEQINEKEISEETNSENIELKEIQISNIETSSSPQKKATGCSRGWCSIL